MEGFKSARRMATVMAAIVAHHGSPEYTYICSVIHSMMLVGPIPYSRPSVFRNPICSGMFRRSLPLRPSSEEGRSVAEISAAAGGDSVGGGCVEA